jgi:HB1, ASXL, restriction endonuclease HTH domain
VRLKSGALVDAYLRLAEEVLRSERRPLSARAMLIAAYRVGIVPPRLHGRTQFKTMGARISEDIVAKRERSAFFRVAPGRFFLREFLTDENLPEEYRQPIITRRRVRELIRGPALALRISDLLKLSQGDHIKCDKVLKLFTMRYDCYDDYRHRKGDSVFVWSFVLVKRKNWVLSYRLGRYRDERDSFMFRRTIGFTTLILESEKTLFNMDDMGIVDAGVKATTIDLDIPIVMSKNSDHISGSIRYFLVSHASEETKDLLAVVDYECPIWFEPVRRRLAINDLVWLDLDQPVNNMDDFDPWSKSVLQTYSHRTPTVAPFPSSSAQQADTRIS